MKRLYKFNNGQDMINLAQEVQTKVYWNKHYIDENDENLAYQHFWDHCEEKIGEGYTGVEIEDDEVTFVR